MLYLYNFEVKYYNEDVDHPSIMKGIVAGESYREAFCTVAEFVGQPDILKIQLEIIADTEDGLLIQDLILNPPLQ